jgi:hypothetical protein
MCSIAVMRAFGRQKGRTAAERRPLESATHRFDRRLCAVEPFDHSLIDKRVKDAAFCRSQVFIV